MADTKISALATASSLAAADLMVIVDDMATTPVSRSLRADALKTYIEDFGETPPYHAITAAETAAGVTPTDYSKEPGNVLRYGALNDGTDAATTTTAIQNAINILTDGGGGVVVIPAGRYACDPLTLKTGVILRGEGRAHRAFYAGDPTGTVLLIDVGAGESAITFEDTNRGMNGIEGMSIFNTGSVAFESIIKINGALHVSLTDVELGNTTATNEGIGLLLNNGTSGGSIYGNYRGIVTSSTLHTGLKLIDAANANSFVGCSFGGATYTMYVTSTTGTYAPKGNGFNGCAFESTYDNTIQDIAFISGADNLHGFANVTNAYIVKVILIEYCDGFSFNGCYFENGGTSGSYDDTVNGSYTIGSVIAVDPATATDAINVRWNGRLAGYIYDKGNNVEVGQLPNAMAYSTRKPIALIMRNSTATVIADSALTAVPYANDPSWHFNNPTEFAYNTSTGVLTFRQQGLYRIHANVFFPATIAAFSYLRANFNSGAVEYYGPAGNGATDETRSLSVDAIYDADVGDTMVIQMYQNSGSGVTLDATANYSHLSVIKL